MGVALEKLAASGAVICFINSNRAWGGGENWHLGAAAYFAGHGCRVVLCAGRGSGLYQMAYDFLAGQAELAERFKLAPWQFSNLDFLNIFKTSRFAAFLRAEGVTHIVAGQTRDMKAALMAARSLPVKVFYRRGLAYPVKDSFVNRRAYAALDGLVANSQATADLLLKNKGMLSPDKVRVIHNAVDIERFDAVLREIPAGYPPPCWGGNGPKRFVIGNAGRLTAQKGQKYLLHMSAELKRRGFAHTLVIAGDGELAEDLLALAQTLGLSVGAKPGSAAEVVFPGFMPDMGQFWRGIDFFMLPSLWEGFGYVLAEAMLARKAVCAFALNSMPELIEDGGNGFLLPPPQPGEGDAQVGARLADLAEKAAARPGELARMGETGRRICEERFEKSLVMEELAAFLQGLD